MPQVFKIGAYLVYFLTNESRPTEPIHVHVTAATPSANDTKIWITSAGHCLLCHNQSLIPNNQLRRIMQVVEARNQEVQAMWLEYFGEISFYC